MYWRLILHIKVFLWLNEPLAALISLATLQNALNNFGYAAVALFIMIESSGIPFPGETMLLLASFYAAVSHQLQIPVVIACAAFGAIIGDNIGRFIALLRAWAAFLAGVNHMYWRTFLFYNAAGGIVWATIYGMLGYIAGRFFHDNFAQVERLATTLGWLGTGFIVVAVLTALIVFRVRRHQRVQATIQARENAENEKEEIKAGL